MARIRLPVAAATAVLISFAGLAACNQRTGADDSSTAGEMSGAQQVGQSSQSTDSAGGMAGQTPDYNQPGGAGQGPDGSGAAGSTGEMGSTGPTDR